MSSFFEDIVRNENGHTALLKSLFERIPCFAAATINQYLNKSFTAEEVAAFEYKLQMRFDGRDISGARRDEIPDLVICGDSFWCVVEVKVDPWLPLEASQLDGYPACFTTIPGHLLFITPQPYVHDRLIESVPVTKFRQTKQARWSGIVDLLKSCINDEDQLASEVAHFWQARFEPVRIDENDIAQLRPWNKALFVATSKAMKLIDETKRLFSAKHPDFATELSTSNREYGFYLKRGRQFLLWMGMWDAASSPFAIGVKKQWLTSLKDLPVGTYPSGGYELRDVPEKSWSNAEAMCAEIERFMREAGLMISLADITPEQNKAIDHSNSQTTDQQGPNGMFVERE